MAGPERGLGHLEQGFLNQAQVTLSNAGFRLDGSALETLISVVISGVQRMRENGEPTPPQLDLARQSLASLAAGIIRQAGLLQAERRITVTEIESSMITDAMLHLCPPGIWPWC